RSLLHTVELTRSAARSASALVAGYGELWSTRLFRELLAQRGKRPGEVRWLDARECVVVEWGPMGPAVQWEESRNALARLAPLVCGTLGEVYGWHYGFAVAGFGMLIGIGIYLAGFKYLPAETAALAGASRPRLQPGESRVVVALVVLLAITALFWIVQAQVWNTYPLWLRDFVDRGVFEMTMPVTWFQALDSLAVLVFAPFVILLWRAQSKRAAEPSDLSKIALGCAFYGLGFVLLGAGQLVAGGGKVELLWPVAFHFACAAGYLYAAPIALALVSRAAPAAVNAMMVGAYYLGIFVGGIVSGWLGRFYEPLQPMAFWLLHAAIVGLGTLAIVVLRRRLVRALKLDASA
ncbi:MAG: hypothetical protein ACRETX_04630, partial [Steroidobacteraceae bacterium]